MRLVRLLAGGLIAIVLIALAVANRQMVTLSLDPFSADEPFMAVALPLFAVLFAGLVIGFAVGAGLTWLAERPHRRAARQSRKVIEKMERDKGEPGTAPLLTVGHND